MAHNINKNQSLQSKGNAYEQQRLQRIQENDEMMRDLGLKKKAKSLKSSKQVKKRNKKTMKQTYTDAIDDDWMPDDTGDDSEEDHQEVVRNAKQVSKKVIRLL